MYVNEVMWPELAWNPLWLASCDHMMCMISLVIGWILIAWGLMSLISIILCCFWWLEYSVYGNAWIVGKNCLIMFDICSSNNYAPSKISHVMIVCILYNGVVWSVTKTTVPPTRRLIPISRTMSVLVVQYPLVGDADSHGCLPSCAPHLA